MSEAEQARNVALDSTEVFNMVDGIRRELDGEVGDLESRITALRLELIDVRTRIQQMNTLRDKLVGLYNEAFDK